VSESSNKDYIKDALLGKRDEDDLLLASDDEDSASVASEAGVDDHGALLLAVEATRNFITSNPNLDTSALVEIVTNQQMASALKSQDKIHILVQAAFTPSFYKNKEVEKFSPAIKSITNSNRIMERHLISALEGICIDKPKNFPVLLKQLYDEDALEEETILEWADEGRTEYTLASVDEECRASLRGEAEPVVVWLQDADSDSDESSSSSK
jgi:translation initiation factor 5